MHPSYLFFPTFTIDKKINSSIVLSSFSSSSSPMIYSPPRLNPSYTTNHPHEVVRNRVIMWTHGSIFVWYLPTFTSLHVAMRIVIHFGLFLFAIKLVLFLWWDFFKNPSRGFHHHSVSSLKFTASNVSNLNNLLCLTRWHVWGSMMTLLYWLGSSIIY